MLSMLLCLTSLVLSPQQTLVCNSLQSAQLLLAQDASFTREGMASWYGPGFAGNLTANGEIFDPSLATAAHPSLPFDTQVKVTNLNNGRSIVVRINDRGPYAGGRIIDLSRAAAEEIGMVRSGVARVRIELLAPVAASPAVAAAPAPAVSAPAAVVAPAAAVTQDTASRHSIAVNWLAEYEVYAAGYEVGDLLMLSSSQVERPLLVRVVGNSIPVTIQADLLVSNHLWTELGADVEITSSE